MEERPGAPRFQDHIKVLNEENDEWRDLSVVRERKRGSRKRKGERAERKKRNHLTCADVTTCQDIVVVPVIVYLPCVATVSSCRCRDLAQVDQATCLPRIHRTARDCDQQQPIRRPSSDKTHESAIGEELHVVSLTHICHAMQRSRINQGELCRADESLIVG